MVSNPISFYHVLSEFVYKHDSFDVQSIELFKDAFSIYVVVYYWMADLIGVGNRSEY